MLPTEYVLVGVKRCSYTSLLRMYVNELNSPVLSYWKQATKETS
jgi:hypothetical protein